MARKKRSDYYVFSTLTTPVDYTAHTAGGGDLKVVSGFVRIEGGANVPDGHLVTPAGVVTGVSADELELLRNNEVFKLHEKNGFIVVSENDEEVEVVAADMDGRSPDAPLVPGDFDPNTAPTVNGGKSSRKA